LRGPSFVPNPRFCARPSHRQLLLGCESAGVMCVTAAAHGRRYLDPEADHHLFPPEQLEFDMRGRVEFPVHRPSFAYIDIGEVKLSIGFDQAIEQLGLRLGVLKWLVLQTQQSIPETDIRLVGRLFTGQSSIKQKGATRAPVNMMDRAAMGWGFSLYMHSFPG
jgi:hypothetical protein